MTYSPIFLAIVSSLFMSACAVSPRQNNGSVAKTHQVVAFESKNKSQEQRVQDNLDKERVLRKKAQLAQGPILSVAPKHLQKLNERDLYAEILRAYDSNNEVRFFSTFNLFMKKYDRGPLADDAVYLAGLLSLDRKNYGPSLKYFNLIIQKYPRGNKVPSAYYAKGIALKKMNLMNESKNALSVVLKKYPGSPEAMRAETELKILSQ